MHVCYKIISDTSITDSPVFRQSEFRHRAISAYGILSIGIMAYGILSIPLLAYSILAMHVNWHIQVKTTT